MTSNDSYQGTAGVSSGNIQQPDTSLPSRTTGGSQPHTHTLDGASEEESSLPPYYALAYIMRCA